MTVVALNGDDWRAVRGDADEGVFVVTGDGDSQSMAFLDQRGDWLQAEFDLSLR